MTKKTILYLFSILILALSGCSGMAEAITDLPSQTNTTSAGTLEPTQVTQVTSSIPITSNYDLEDLTVSVPDTGTTVINLDGDKIVVEGNGVTEEGSTVTITAAGVYTIQGVLDDGQIIVNTQDAESITLILDGASITNTTSAPIYIANAEKAIITLADGTENTLFDGETYYYPDESDEPNAALFSNDDLTINGNGTLNVTANYKNGIASDDDLKIISGTISVNAVNDGIKGKDSVSIKDGMITINSGADGIQSTNADDAEKGFILIEGGMLDITSNLDGIQAETSLQISGGNLSITTGGGSVNTSTTGGGIWGVRGMEGNPNKPTESAKGLKAGVDMSIEGGTFTINSADDTIHANNSIIINGGDFLLTSGDDGIHADSTLTINQGQITIVQSYEGLESAVLTINDGTIHVTSSDDGLNAAGGNDGSAINGRPGQNQFDFSGDYRLDINGGYLFVDANGDGLDINGPIEMTDGVVIINGPTANNNGALDYSGWFNITGGYLLAVGSSGMAQAPSESSTQYSFMYNFDTMQAAGTLVNLQSQTGQEILTFIPTKEYQSLVLSSPMLQNGETYLVYTGGSSDGTATDGLYTDGVYTPGTQVAGLNISSMVTAGGMVGTGPGGGGPPGGMQPNRP